MSPTPPKLETSEGPNPLELFFEKNKKWLYGLAALLVVGLAVNYGLKQLDQAKINKEWREFTAETGLAATFSAPIELMQMPPQAQGNPQYEQFIRMQQFQQIASRQRELVTKLMDDIRNADLPEIDRQIAASKGHPKQPWLIWVAANKLYGEGDWAGARTRCERLKSEFGNHFLCAQSPYPVQVRPEKDEPDKDEKKDEKDKPKKDKKKELEPPVPGTAVDNLLAAITKDEQFRKDRPHFFTPPAPDSTETAVIKFADHGEIEIAFYPNAAPKHVEAFKKNFETGYYNEMRVDKIKRKPKTRGDENTPKTMHLGNPKSKGENREEWATPVEAEEKDMLEFESGMPNLSFFPYMVGAEQEKDGKSSARRFFICGNDCAANFDGEYVILGRVIRGTEHVDEIVSGDMADETQENAGEGRPGVDVRVESATLSKPK